MFPDEVWVNDLMHMYFNALEEAIEGDPEWNEFQDNLRIGIQGFLGNKGLRQRWMSTIPAAEARKVARYAKRHIDWKWEYLEKELGQLEPILETLFKWCHRGQGTGIGAPRLGG